MLKNLYHSISFVIIINIVLKPFWIFGIENKIQHLIGNIAYGEFYNIYNIATIGSIIIDFGLSQFYITNYNNIMASTAKKQLAQLVIIKLFLSLLFTATIFIVCYFLGFQNKLLVLFIILQQIITALIGLLRTHFAANQQFNIDSIFGIADKLISTIILGIFLYIYCNNCIISAKQFVLLQVMVSALILLLLLYKVIGNLKLQKWNFKVLSSLFKGAFPFAVMVLCMALLLKSDVILLTKLHSNGESEAGKFASGYRILDALNSFTFLIIGVFFPFCCKHLHNKILLQKSTKQLTIFLLTLAITISCITYIFKNNLSAYLFINNNSQAAYILWHCTTGFVGYVFIHIYSTILTVFQKIKTLIYTTLFFISILLIAHISITPNYGAIGVSIITTVIPLLYGLTLFGICKHKKLV